MTAISAGALESQLAHLDADQLDSLGSILRERARLRRVLLTEAEARTAIASAPLTSAWELSQLRDVGRVRTATRLLVERGWHPEQIVDEMTNVAMEVCPHALVAAEAVAAGVADGLYAREGVEDV